jgi:hypothetical protein
MFPRDFKHYNGKKEEIIEEKIVIKVYESYCDFRWVPYRGSRGISVHFCSTWVLILQK